MDLTNARATFGLNAKATPVKSGSSGTIQIGDSNASISLTDATKIISFDAVIVGSSSNLIIDVSDLDNTGSTAWTAGTQQVETNTVVAASGITTSGNATVTVTATGMAGTPKAISVPVTTAAHATATLIAAALADGLNADTAFSALFIASNSGANLLAKSKPTSTYTVNGTSIPVYPADVADLNVAIANGTCAGITNDATSTSTTAGVATAGAYAPDLDGTDFEGEATSGLSSVDGVFIKNSPDSATSALLTRTGDLTTFPIGIGGFFQTACATGIVSGADDLTITPDSNGDDSCLVTVTIAGA